jgi:hypothetical protein
LTNASYAEYESCDIIEQSAAKKRERWGSVSAAHASLLMDKPVVHVSWGAKDVFLVPDKTESREDATIRAVYLACGVGPRNQSRTHLYEEELGCGYGAQAGPASHF